jgi:glycosyltransferase involved in cell wall biosynthesis
MIDVAIGVTSYNRPDALGDCLSSVLQCAPLGARLMVSDDGSTDPEVHEILDHAEREMGFTILRGEHANVATSKNRLLDAAMNDGAEHIFLVEDDMTPQDPKAFRSYIKASERWGMQHSMYAHAGERNFQVDTDHAFTYHYECVGSWVYYSRAAVEYAGLFDTEFQNCWEHVVHSMIIADSGLFMPGAGWRRWPDVRFSADHIVELLAASTHVTGTEDELMRSERIQAGLRHWRDTYRFPDDVAPLLKD